jgi:hypothetical protein
MAPQTLSHRYLTHDPSYALVGLNGSTVHSWCTSSHSTALSVMFGAWNVEMSEQTYSALHEHAMVLVSDVRVYAPGYTCPS